MTVCKQTFVLDVSWGVEDHHIVKSHRQGSTDFRSQCSVFMVHSDYMAHNFSLVCPVCDQTWMVGFPWGVEGHHIVKGQKTFRGQC